MLSFRAKTKTNTCWNKKPILVVAKAGAKVDVERLRNVDRVLYWDEDCSDLGGRVKTLATFLNLGAEVGNILRDLGGISFLDYIKIIIYF